VSWVEHTAWEYRQLKAMQQRRVMFSRVPALIAPNPSHSG